MAGALGGVAFEIHQLIFKHTLVHINTLPWIFLPYPHTPTHNLVSYIFVLSPKKKKKAQRQKHFLWTFPVWLAVILRSSEESKICNKWELQREEEKILWSLCMFFPLICSHDPMISELFIPWFPLRSLLHTHTAALTNKASHTHMH